MHDVDAIVRILDVLRVGARESNGPLACAVALGLVRELECAIFGPQGYVPPQGLTAEEQALIRSSHQINAIKAVRARTGLGLKEAKDLVEAWAATQGLAQGAPCGERST